ncbi:MAG: 50S ribosomal protein L17 [Candidatus Lindowbacteria bacterium RIFCSPLOWO2_12_FULL_62_27]|nr:MAG: 50S ribosomal protein L17 [Candidatus Lindowbacteria bacterium RIFCSPLOWO2_12_FULL_62_27]OGH63584.1 MAG: 50S ribosomal protein L17 [Candidatus Lindowbacteria bacterium RIFCSPLOWO2_02_FULL_62_12]
MKHGRKLAKLGRPRALRKALLRGLATSLFKHGRITTTLPKAKGLRPYAERLLTHARRGTLHARRLVRRAISDRIVLAKLFNEIAPKYKERNGGYTRILRIQNRLGDNATQAIIELV